MSQESAPREEELVSVRSVPDEATATMLRDFLSGQGIEATAISAQIPWFGTIETARKGYWGRIAVMARDAARARALLDDFYAARPVDDESSPTAENDEGE